MFRLLRHAAAKRTFRIFKEEHSALLKMEDRRWRCLRIARCIEFFHLLSSIIKTPVGFQPSCTRSYWALRRPPCKVLSYPPNGVARYGNSVKKSLSFLSTPSPTMLFGLLFGKPNSVFSAAP